MTVSTNDVDPKNIKGNKKPYEVVLIYFIGYKTSNGVKPLYIIFSKINGYIEVSFKIYLIINRSKYLTLITANNTKGRLKKR